MSSYLRINSSTQINDEDQSPQHPDTTSNLRIVSDQQCNALKRNIALLLQEQNESIYQSFNLQDFAIIFKQILPNSDDEEIVKLFNYVDGQKHENTKTVSFDGILNQSRNFHKLLHSMGCELDINNDSDSDSYTDSDSEPLTPRPLNAEFDCKSTLVPQLSFMQVYRSTADVTNGANFLSQNQTLSSMKCVNTNNYTEYIGYQKEQIEDLKNTIAKLQRHETKCNELQFMLDTKCKMIDNLKEEIKQLNMDKNECMTEVQNIREQYNELTQKVFDLNQYQKTHDSEQQSNVLMEENIQHIKTEFSFQKKKSFELQSQKKHLSEMNQQFTKINEHLRNKLQNEKQKINELKELTDLKDDEIRHLTVEILNKDHVIQQLQNDNEDLSAQLNYAFGQSDHETVSVQNTIHAHGSQETVDWRNVQSFYAKADNLEFDIFQDLENIVISNRNTIRSIEGYNDFSTRSLNVTERNRYNDYEDENIEEETQLEYENAVLLNKIDELQDELLRNKTEFKAELQRNKNRFKAKLQRNKTEIKEKSAGFWHKCFQTYFD